MDHILQTNMTARELMVTDEESEKLQAFMVAKRQADYLQRGRLLRRVGSPELKRRWQALFREWSKDLRAPLDHRLRRDIESELELRGEEVPIDPVVYRRFRRAFLKLRDDPSAWPDPDRPVDPEFEEFLQTLERPQ